MSDSGEDVSKSGRVEYAGRLFREPVDPGIAQPDRAVSSVRHGTRSHLEGTGGEGRAWYEGGGSMADQAVQGITIYPPTRGVQTQGDAFEPVKVGVLIDMDLNQLLADWIDKGYKGDLLTIRELRHGDLRFDGYFRPEWPSNASVS